MKNKVPIKFLCRGALLLLGLSVLGILENQYANASGILKSYKGGPQEKALDAQIKAYRNSAIKNMEVFGHPQGLRIHRMRGINPESIGQWVHKNYQEFKSLGQELQKSRVGRNQGGPR